MSVPWIRTGQKKCSCAGSRLRVEDDRNPLDAGRNFLKRLEPLPHHGWFEVGEPGDVAPRPRDARNKAAAHGIGHTRKHDRDRRRLPQQCGGGRCRIADQYIRPQCYQLSCKEPRLIGTGWRKAIVNSDVAALGPTRILERLSKCKQAGLSFRIVSGIPNQYSNSPHLISLLCPRSN